MRISGTADLLAPPERVFEALNDPAVLAATIPGCEGLQQVSDDTYAMTVTAGVASIKGTYEGRVVLADQQPPTSFTLRASGSGAPGSVDATVGVRLAAHDGGTRVEYDADAVVGGMVGGVGQRMLSGVSKRMAGQFFGAVDRVIAEGVPVQQPAEAATQGEPAVASPVPAVARAASPAADTVPAWLVPAAIGATAAWVLAGVALGWALGRRSRS
ncbi:carbon monoxide dehydrogenase subunit G [Angustibacter speluncae]